MNYQDFKENKEIGKLIQFGYDLHKREFESDYYSVPNTEDGIHNLKIFNNGAIRGIVFFTDHTTCDACIELIVMKDFDNDYNPRVCQIIYTNTEHYRPSFNELKLNPENGVLENSYEELSLEEKFNRFIELLEFIGFKREDIIKVFNKELTAREAYQNVADEEYKNRQWIAFERKIYEFDNNIAISGDYSGIYTDYFPFPFEEQPVLDCSRVQTSGVNLKRNAKQVKLININSNPKSIIGTNLKEAIIDEVIDASKVDISYTIFGEQTVINIDKSISKKTTPKYLRLAYTDKEKEIEKPRIKLLSTSSGIDSTIEAISNGTEGIGLFRDEMVLESNHDLTSALVKIINIDWSLSDYHQQFIKQIEELFYNNATKLFKLLNDIPITFRLTDIKPEELSNKANIPLVEDYIDIRGTKALLRLRDVLHSESRGLIRAAKENDKTLNILIPYVTNESSFIASKNTILQIAKEENYHNIRIGAMIENTEVIQEVDKIAEQADFISIGTNDLSESVLHKKRSINDRDFQILNEEVKIYINKIVHRVKRSNNIPINICGEHSNYFENIEYYLSLNIDTITCSQKLLLGYNDFLNTYYEKNKQKQKGTD